jgi:hypothetical protein
VVGHDDVVVTAGSDGDKVRADTWAQQLHTLYFDHERHVRRRRRQRLVAALAAGAVVAAAIVYLVAEDARSARRQAGGRSAVGQIRPGSSSVLSTASSLPPPASEPGGGRSLLPGHRIVAFYGAAGVARLGVLGQADPEQLWPSLVAQATPYDQPATPVIPAYELIAFATQAAPGPSHTYTARVSDNTIERYLRVVRAHRGLLILDIQPGRSDFLEDSQSLTDWLAQPDVGLALDPEWKLDANQLPSRQIGHTTASALNAVSTWLSQLVASRNLPQKLLLIHQFTPAMVTDKPSVQAPPGLALVFNMDGFGAQAAKLSKYQALAADSRFALGFKIFYRQDKSPFTASDLLAVVPTPDVVEYQ